MTVKCRLFTQYCEDVRQEADGRHSLMGVFPISLSVGLENNAKIPRIFVQAVVSMSAKEDINSLKIVVKWNGRTINEVLLPDEDLQRLKEKQLDSSTSDAGELIVTAYAAMFDLEVKEGGQLNTDAEVNGTIIKGRPLRFHIEKS